MKASPSVRSLPSDQDLIEQTKRKGGKQRFPPFLQGFMGDIEALSLVSIRKASLFAEYALGGVIK